MMRRNHIVYRKSLLRWSIDKRRRVVGACARAVVRGAAQRGV